MTLLLTTAWLYLKRKIQPFDRDSKVTSYSNDNYVVDVMAITVNNPQKQQENKYQSGHRIKQMIMQ
jgi:hypothetical protein